MSIPAKHDFGALTEKEKATLRLIVRGHDAKSIARTLGLSVHTINERLREARRKVAVSSSREAARLLFEAEGSGVAPGPEIVGDSEIGGAAPPRPGDEGAAPIPGAGRRRRPWLTIGVVLMLPALTLLAFAALPQLDAPPAPSPAPMEAGMEPAVGAAQRFLALIDQAQWGASYAATGASFHKVNSVKLWADTSQQVRAPLGAMVARTLLGAERVAAPPHGLTVVKFRTQFATKPVTETVTLDREHGDWRVVGVALD